MPTFFNSSRPSIEDMGQMLSIQGDITSLKQTRLKTKALSRQVKQAINDFMKNASTIKLLIKEGTLTGNSAITLTLTDAENFTANFRIKFFMHAFSLALETLSVLLIFVPDMGVIDIEASKTIAFRLTGSLAFILALLNHITDIFSFNDTPKDLENNVLRDAPLQFDESFNHEMLKVVSTVNALGSPSPLIIPTQHTDAILNSDGERYHATDKPYGYHAHDLLLLLKQAELKLNQKIDILKIQELEYRKPLNKRTLMSNQELPMTALNL